MPIGVKYFPALGNWNLSPKELFFDSVVSGQKYRTGMRPKDYPFYAFAPVVNGVVQYNSARFFVDKDGNLVATNAQITGKIIAGANSEIDWSYIKNVLVQDAQIQSLSANKITAGTGIINALDIKNSLTIASGGCIKQGQTAYDSGIGFWLGDVGGTPKFSIGNSAGNKLTWDGSTLTIYGKIQTGAGSLINGTYIDSLDAGKITTGYLSAARLDTTVAYITNSAMIANAVITNAHIVSLDAGKITTGTLNAALVNVINLNANNITTGTLTGRTVQTASSGQRVVLESGSAGLIRFYSSSYETATFYGSGTDIMISTSQSSGKILLSVGSSGAIAFAVGGTVKSYFDAVGDLHIGSGNAILNNSSNTAQLSLNKHFMPSADNSYTLGSSGLRWSDLRAMTATFSGNITINSLNLSGSNQGILVNNVSFMNFVDQSSYGQIIFQRGAAGCDLLPYGDNYGQIGYDSRRWSRVRAITITSGDLEFENKFRITEEGKTGLAFFNQKNKKIAILDDKGNFYVKGKIYEEDNL